MWVYVCKKVSDIPEHGLGMEVDGRHIAVFRIDGQVYATNNICTHQFALLTEGCLDGEFIECPMHQGRFHVPSGQAQGTPVTVDVETYPVRVTDVGVEVDLKSADGV